MTVQSIAQSNPSWTLEQRRAFLRLPLAERRRQMAEQAQRMSEIQDTAAEDHERHEWQGGDLVEY